MLSLLRGSDRSPTDATGRRRRLRGPLAASLAVNAVLVAGFVAAVARGYRISDLWEDEATARTTERVVFTPTPGSGQPGGATRDGGDGLPVAERRATATPPLRAPTRVPDGIPAPGAPVADAGGSGAVVGAGGAAPGSGGGPATGIRPSYSDPRVWDRPGVAAAPRSQKQRIDSVIADLLAPVRDSIATANALAAGQRKPGDWTVDGPGGKWGMDQSSIHLGKVKVPNAVLALLSESFQKNLRGNPTEMEYARRQNTIREDLMRHADREINEDQFREAVKQLRDRKDRERKARLAEQQRLQELYGQPVQADAGSSGGGNSAPPR